MLILRTNNGDCLIIFVRETFIDPLIPGDDAHARTHTHARVRSYYTRWIIHYTGQVSNVSCVIYPHHLIKSVSPRGTSVVSHCIHHVPQYSDRHNISIKQYCWFVSDSAIRNSLCAGIERTNQLKRFFGVPCTVINCTCLPAVQPFVRVLNVGVANGFLSFTRFGIPVKYQILFALQLTTITRLIYSSVITLAVDVYMHFRNMTLKVFWSYLF